MNNIIFRNNAISVLMLYLETRVMDNCKLCGANTLLEQKSRSLLSTVSSHIKEAITSTLSNERDLESRIMIPRHVTLLKDASAGRVGE